MGRWRCHAAFTLVELVVVILVLGILASVAARKMFNASSDATDTGVRHSLEVVRDAIDVFMWQNNRLPGSDGVEATFKNDLEPLLRSFPKLPVGPATGQNDSVLMSADLGAASGESSPTQGWKYYWKTGQFIVNFNGPTATDATRRYDEL